MKGCVVMLHCLLVYLSVCVCVCFLWCKTFYLFFFFTYCNFILLVVDFVFVILGLL
jgi:hypothetical protein